MNLIHPSIYDHLFSSVTLGLVKMILLINAVKCHILDVTVILLC